MNNPCEIVERLRAAKANGDPTKYVHVITVSEAWQAATIIETLQAERLVLREALEEISAMGEEKGDLNWGHAQDAIDIARTALNPEGGNQ